MVTIIITNILGVANYLYIQSVIESVQPINQEITCVNMKNLTLYISTINGATANSSFTIQVTSNNYTTNIILPINQVFYTNIYGKPFEGVTRPIFMFTQNFTSGKPITLTASFYSASDGSGGGKLTITQ